MFDLMLTDPPYGINGGNGGTSKLRARGQYIGAFSCDDDTRDFVKSVVVPIVFIGLWKCHAIIVTPGNNNLSLYPRSDSFGCMYQPQSAGAQRWGWCDAQPILYYGKSPVQGQKLEPCSFRVVSADECDNGHPCPKPLSFWKKLLIKGCAEGGSVVDPFMGSGTTLVAAKQLNRASIGIEIEERYCEIAARRLSQEVFDFNAESSPTLAVAEQEALALT